MIGIGFQYNQLEKQVIRLLVQKIQKIESWKECPLSKMKLV
jgi:hypothetical protein